MDRISYRQLQAFAKVMKLPGNMKYQVLWELVQARKSGNERLVSQLLAEQNRIRIKRRINRKAAKIHAEALGRLIRQEDNNNAALSYDINQDRNSICTPPHEPQMVDLETKLCVASLLDMQLRYNVMMNEAQFCRNAVLQLPILTTHPVYNQFSGLQYHPPSNSPSVPIESFQDSVKLHPFVDVGNSDDNIGHIEVVATDFRAKATQFKPVEPKKPSFQIEDIIASTPSTTYASTYSNKYQMNYNSYVDCTTKEMGTFIPPSVNIPQDSLDPWRKHYVDVVSGPRSVSSNGSQSSLFIDTSQLSPMSSDTLSGNEICEDPTVSNNYESTIETIGEVSLHPSYQTLASNFLSVLDNPVLCDVDGRGHYSQVVQEITYQETEPSLSMATVIFPKRDDPLELKNSENELANEDSKIYDGLKQLHKSLGIHITTENMKAPDLERTECDLADAEEEKSVPDTQVTKIEKNSSPFSGVSFYWNSSEKFSWNIFAKIFVQTSNY